MALKTNPNGMYATWLVSNCDETEGAKIRFKYAQDLVSIGLKLDGFGTCFDRPLQPPGASYTFSNIFQYFSKTPFYRKCPSASAVKKMAFNSSNMAHWPLTSFILPSKILFIATITFPRSFGATRLTRAWCRSLWVRIQIRVIFWSFLSTFRLVNRFEWLRRQKTRNNLVSWNKISKIRKRKIFWPWLKKHPNPDDLAAIAPPHSFIHVEDFKSNAALVDYLDYLDGNDTAYAEYHQWRLTTPKTDYDYMPKSNREFFFVISKLLRVFFKELFFWNTFFK